MKKFNFYCILLFTAITLFSMSSCSKDEDEETIVDLKVVINTDGSTSNGSVFSAIDDKRFYLDNIRYTVEEEHLVVSGFDGGLNGNAKIASSITYKQKSYDVLGISDYAFNSCEKLTSITIPNSVTNIGYGAFRSCKGLTSITIPNSVTFIGSYAFYECINLTSITIPNSVTSIGDYPFFSCPKLEKIIVSNENTYFDSRDNCNAIILTATNTLLFGCKNSIIPNGVTSIENSAFDCCTGLTSITIPNSVVSIGMEAFYGCSGLTSITIPNSVTSIGGGAFSGCPKLEKIIVSNENTYFDSRDNCNAIILTATNTLLFGCKNSIIPNSVTTIGEGAFSGCTNLTSITIPNSVTNIGGGAFYGCTGLTSITIPNSVTRIGDYAFRSCTGLTSITIPNSVTSIGDYAFSGCSGLTSITIPNSVVSIGMEAFYGCTGLTAIHCLSSTPPTISSYSGTFNNDTYSKATLYVPQGSLGAYKVAAGWINFQNIIEE